MSFVSFLYKVARTANTVNAITKPARLPRRMKNIALGRALGKVGFWKIWK